MKPNHSIRHAIIQKFQDRKEIFWETSLFLYRRYEELSKIVHSDNFFSCCITSTGGREEQVLTNRLFHSIHSSRCNNVFETINQQKTREQLCATHNLFQNKATVKQWSSRSRNLLALVYTSDQSPCHISFRHYLFHTKAPSFYKPNKLERGAQP